MGCLLFPWKTWRDSNRPLCLFTGTQADTLSGHLAPSVSDVTRKPQSSWTRIKKKKGAKSIRLHSVHKDKRCNQVTARAQPKSQKKPKGSNIQAISPTAKVAWHREGRPPSFPVSHTLWAPLSLHSGPKESTPLGTANCIMTRFSIRVGRDWSAHYVWFNLYSHANFFLDEADSTSKEFTILGHSRAIRTRLKHTV